MKELVAELRAIRAEHSNCQNEQASMRVTISYLKEDNAKSRMEVADLKEQIGEMRKQAGIWQKIETKARIEGDAANAEHPQ